MHRGARVSDHTCGRRSCWSELDTANLFKVAMKFPNSQDLIIAFLLCFSTFVSADVRVKIYLLHNLGVSHDAELVYVAKTLFAGEGKQVLLLVVVSAL